MATKWLEFRMGGTEWTVLVGSVEEFPGLSEDEGYTDTNTSEIHIWEELKQSRKVSVLIHEMLHASLSAPGGGGQFARIAKCPEDEAHDREEAIVTHISPALVEGLLSAKILRAPRIKTKAEKSEP